jgi:hypothetical protein
LQDGFIPQLSYCRDGLGWAGDMQPEKGNRQKIMELVLLFPHVIEYFLSYQSCSPQNMKMYGSPTKWINAFPQMILASRFINPFARKTNTTHIKIYLPNAKATTNSSIHLKVKITKGTSIHLLKAKAKDNISLHLPKVKIPKRTNISLIGLLEDILTRGRRL